MLAVPAGHTETGAVLALPVLVAAHVAQFRVAVLAAPALVALAGLAHTAAVLATLQVAELCEIGQSLINTVGNSRLCSNSIRWHLISLNYVLSMYVPFEQSSPLHLGSQEHVCVSKSKVPCPVQSGRHCNASLSMVAQSAPFQPFLQMHVPSAQ